MMANTTNNDPIKEVINKLKKGIIKLQNPSGWYPFAISKERSIIGIWATGQAVAALSQIDATLYSKEVHSAIRWLISHQKEGGGWGVMLQEKASVESTAWIVMELSKFESEYREPLTKAIKWLKTNQNGDGGWGSWKGDASRTVTTSLSIIALSSIERERNIQELDKAIKWLEINQNEDGGWGFGLDDQSNVLATSYALIALLNKGGNKKNEYIQNAVEFLREHQHKDGFFGEEPFIVETIGRETGIARWQHFNTPPSILALAMSGSIDITLYKGIKWLLDNQVENYSASPTLSFPYHTYVTLYCIVKASRLIDSNRFKVYLDMIAELEKGESEAQFLAKRRRLKRLIIENALFLGDFELSSGRKSNYYFDMKRITQDPEASEIIADIFLYPMKDKNVDSVGGLEIGAVPIATAISMRSHNTKKPITAFFVRDQRKGHGTKRRIDGILKKKSNVIIVDDVTTTGSSILTAINEVEREGCNIKGVFTIVDRCEGAKEVLLEKGYELKSIFEINEFKDIIFPRDKSNKGKNL
jgi:orotate phosphoribosyltransferase